MMNISYSNQIGLSNFRYEPDQADLLANGPPLTGGGAFSRAGPEAAT